MDVIIEGVEYCGYLQSVVFSCCALHPLLAAAICCFPGLFHLAACLVHPA